MHRKTIEHPDYLPEAVRKHTDFDSGRNTGRIYRLYRDKARSAGRPSLPGDERLDEASNLDLSLLLSALGGWQQDTAQRLLLERLRSTPDPVTTTWLKRLALGGPAANSPIAGATVHALGLLERTGQLDRETISAAILHPATPVRVHAIQLAASRLRDWPAGEELVIQAADDPDPRVRFFAALALGKAPADHDPAPIARIALRDAEDRWARAARAQFNRRPRAGVSRGARQGARAGATRSGRVVLRVRPGAGRRGAGRGLAGVSDPDHDRLARCAARTADTAPGRHRREPAATRKRESTNLLTATLGDAARGEPSVRQAIAALVERLRPNGGRRRAIARPAPLERGPGRLQRFRTCTPNAARARRSRSARRAAGRRRPCAGRHAGRRGRRGAAQPRPAPPLRAAAPRGSPLGPSRRHAPRTGAAGSVEAGTVNPADLDLSLRRRLTEHRDEAIRTRAVQLWGGLPGGDRMAVYEDYKSVASLPADPQNGWRVLAELVPSVIDWTGRGYRSGRTCLAFAISPRKRSCCTSSCLTAKLPRPLPPTRC